MMKKTNYIVVESSATDELGFTACDDLNDAIAEAQGMWEHMSDYDRKRNTIEVRKYVDDECGDYETFEWQIKKWYAVESDRNDTDWGVGSYDKEEAEEMLREYPDGILAEIEEVPYYIGETIGWSKECVWETPCSEIWG